MNFKIFYLITILIVTGCSLKKKGTHSKKDTHSIPKATQTKEKLPSPLTISKTPSVASKPITPIVTKADATKAEATDITDAGTETNVTSAKAEAETSTNVNANTDVGITSSVNVTQKITTLPLLNPTDDSPATQIALGVCHFPSSLKQATETQLEMNCADITAKHLSQIKQLTIRNINKEELNKLHNGNYTYLFTSLETLDISENPSLSYLPSFVTDLSTLNELNISRTGVSDFSLDICNLKKLTHLKANHNNYKNQEVPINTFCLSTLKTLDMSYSSIRYIDEYIYKLENLEELYMRNNELMVVPFMLHIMPNLLLVDFTENMFTEPTWWASLFGYRSYNDSHSCKNIQDIDDKTECQEDMLDNFRCGWWYKLPFERGYPFRRYKEMTDKEFEAHTAEGKLPSKDKCYLYWLHKKYIPSSEEEKAAYSEHTINGKTLREWRVVFPAIVEHWGDWYGFKQSFTYCGQVMLYADTSYGPDSHEIFPSEYDVEGEWSFPTECEKDRYLYD